MIAIKQIHPWQDFLFIPKLVLAMVVATQRGELMLITRDTLRVSSHQLARFPSYCNLPLPALPLLPNTGNDEVVKVLSTQACSSQIPQHQTDHRQASPKSVGATGETGPTKQDKGGGLLVNSTTKTPWFFSIWSWQVGKAFRGFRHINAGHIHMVANPVC